MSTLPDTTIKVVLTCEALFKDGKITSIKARNPAYEGTMFDMPATIWHDGREMDHDRLIRMVFCSAMDTYIQRYVIRNATRCPHGADCCRDNAGMGERPCDTSE